MPEIEPSLLRPARPAPRPVPGEISTEKRAAPKKRPPRPWKRDVSAAVTVVLLLAVLPITCIFPLRLHLPNTGKSETANTASPALSAAEFYNETESAALAGLADIPRIYRLAPDLTVFPEPDSSAYGETADTAELRSVIDDAAELLDGQETLWNEEVPLRRYTKMNYYRDDSILALTWQETLNRWVIATFAEVKLADASQLRRKLCEDTYGSPVQQFPMELAESCNAVLATSGDFYRYQKQGVHVYNGEIFRSDGLEKLDTCFFTRSGDLLFVHRGELADEEALQHYIEENDVSFSCCFGPILIENGEDISLESGRMYPLGECGQPYSRTAIAQLGPLHYVVMVVYSDVPLYMSSRFLADKGVQNAYALDGGQSGTIVLDGKHINPYQYGSARTQSDILCFATAVLPEKQPESEG